ncbi:MAG: hypothetical protein Q8867_07955 [Bacteroidota bacterium]|nr:hypothetical protein [Bacteroidota bacterium]
MRLLTVTFNGAFIDSNVWLIALCIFCTVLASLAILAFVFARIHTIQDYRNRRKMKKEEEIQAAKPKKPVITGEENAAIATALFLYFSEMHDEEQYVTTIRKVSRTYSPWNAKIYGIWNSMKR